MDATENRPMHSTRFVLGLALLLIALPTARAADDDVVTRLYDVGALLQVDSLPDGTPNGSGR